MKAVDKILAKMKQNPRGWKIEQLENVAQSLGISVRRGKGSHVVFTHEHWIELLTIPAHRPIKPVYVRKLTKLAETLIGVEDEDQ